MTWAIVLIGTTSVTSAHDAIAYVATAPSKNIIELDLATRTVSRSIYVAAHALDIAFTPDGSKGVLAADDGVGIIDVETATEIGQSVGSTGGLNKLAISPDGRTAVPIYPGAKFMFTVNLGTGESSRPIQLPGLPAAVAITPDGRTAFIAEHTPLFAERQPNSVIPLDLATQTVGPQIWLGPEEVEPSAIAITPDGRTAYVAGQLYGRVIPIDLATRTAGPPITTHTGPITDLAITPDGKTAYVTDEQIDAITPIDLATGTPGTPIPVGRRPDSIAITADGRMAYVAAMEGADITPVDLATGTPQAPIPVGPYPLKIAIAPQRSLAPVAPTTSVPAPLGASPAPSANRGQCIVPNVIHLRLRVARKRLVEHHCRVGHVRYRHSHRRGHLIWQAPRPGTRIPAHGRVNLTISLGTHRS